MGKLKKMIAGLATVLSLGSVSSYAQNVFASSTNIVKNTIQNNEEREEKPFAKMTSEDVNRLFGSLTIDGKTYENSIYLLQKTTQKKPFLKKPFLYDSDEVENKLVNYCETNEIYALGNGLLCKLNGEIVTYSDVFTGVEVLGDLNVPILAKNEYWRGEKRWGVKVFTRRNHVKQLLLTDEKHPFLCDRFLESQKLRLSLDGDRLIDQNTGTYLRCNLGFSSTTRKENALKVDNSVFGLPSYNPPTS